MNNTQIRFVSFCLTLVLAVVTLCACAPQTPSDNPPDDTPGQYAAEAGRALELVNKALENNQFVMDRTTPSYTAHVVSEGNSLFVSTVSEEETEANLWQYQDTIHCWLYMFSGGEWKKYETATSEHEWNITRPRASYFPILEQIRAALAYENAQPDKEGVYHFDFDDPVTMHVEGGKLYIDGQSGIFNGSTVVSEIGTAVTVVTEEMQNAPQYEYIHSQK